MMLSTFSCVYWLSLVWYLFFFFSVVSFYIDKIIVSERNQWQILFIYILYKILEMEDRLVIAKESIGRSGS